ncbi:hypothetical protein M408DRAFT_331365 [Serendipita vermifera MAFF 305830]|uniref:Vacuolar import/degradation Vid27 C-terminal domain-containing protein n=1 Tax=Serendipita vermifera MAFF 305830 TaxID=933852 RepID=A0A0C3AZ76_SERVB|nr:hypothetical protein M408DRAFT_334164 [Serendipita vermifera MAFF 305830]KIM25269.1 hypothetical protein M408DRAFT_331365 [Serendipita vermifera MAFF 305830]
MGKTPTKGASEEVAQLPEGELYILRRNSAKGLRECIFTTAVATVRRTETPFEYQLVITRAYQEGEAELLDDLDEDDDEDRTFLIDEQLMPRIGTFEGSTTFIWRDLDEADATGSSSDENLYEFVVDGRRTDGVTFGAFYEAILRGIYEKKFNRSSIAVTLPELKQQFDKHPVPSSSLTETQKLPPAIEQVADDEFIAKEEGDLYIWSNELGGFKPVVDGPVEARVVQTGQYTYWLIAKHEGSHVLAHQITEEMNGQSSTELLSWTWNNVTSTGVVDAWAIRFGDSGALNRFIHALSRAFYEVQNAIDWEKMKEIEQNYVITAMTEDVEMADGDAEDEAEVEGALNADDEDTADEDESDQEPTDWGTQKKTKNTGMAVGYKGISVVLRGDRLGVFRATNDGKMELGGTVNQIKGPGKNDKAFEPSKVMLHDQDRSLILMNPQNEHALYQMDLETGKVVEEWKVHDDITINAMAPVDKFAQMNPEETFLGTSHNAIFRIDPRLDKNKLAQDGLKQYATKAKFSSIATTEKGHIAVGSEKGDIRLFDTLGKNAKTALPALGDAVRGLDVTRDGRWVVATCKTYLLLIDTQIGSGKNVGSSGFTKSFPADSKPRPKRLQLRPEHVSFMGSQINFSPAKFNTGPDSKETSIVTSNGAFVIAWDFEKVKKGKLDRYEVKRYTSNVVEDNFSWGNDKEIIVTLQDNVLMLPKKALQKPSRLSQGPGDRKSRSNIVNAPY